MGKDKYSLTDRIDKKDAMLILFFREIDLSPKSKSKSSMV